MNHLFESNPEFTRDYISDICTSGDNGHAVSKWADKLNIPYNYLVERASQDKTDEEIEAMSERELKEYVVWNMAWDLYEQSPC